MQRKIMTGGLLILASVFSVNAGLAEQDKTAAPSSIAQPSDAEKGLRAANDQFYAALNAMFVGDLAPMNAIWAHDEDVTDMGPFGGRLTGWKAVGAEFKKEGAMKLGGRVVCKDLIVRVGGDMGYTVCVEEGENMSADGKPIVVKFRATNVFRLIKGQWKLVHHHTDISQPLETATGVAK